MNNKNEETTSKLSLKENEIHLWSIDPTQITSKVLIKKYKELQTADETIKQQRYRFDKDKHSALITRAFERDLLSYCKKLSPGKAEIYRETSSKKIGANLQILPNFARLNFITFLPRKELHISNLNWRRQVLFNRAALNTNKIIIHNQFTKKSVSYTRSFKSFILRTLLTCLTFIMLLFLSPLLKFKILKSIKKYKSLEFWKDFLRI